MVSILVKLAYILTREEYKVDTSNFDEKQVIITVAKLLIPSCFTFTMYDHKNIGEYNMFKSYGEFIIQIFNTLMYLCGRYQRYKLKSFRCVYGCLNDVEHKCNTHERPYSRCDYLFIITIDNDIPREKYNWFYLSSVLRA